MNESLKMKHILYLVSIIHAHETQSNFVSKYSTSVQLDCCSCLLIRNWFVHIRILTDALGSHDASFRLCRANIPEGVRTDCQTLYQPLHQALHNAQDVKSVCFCTLNSTGAERVCLCIAAIFHFWLTGQSCLKSASH